MVQIKLTATITMGGKDVELDAIDLQFEAFSESSSISIKANSTVKVGLGNDKLPILVIIESSKKLTPGDLVYSDKVPTLTIAPNASDDLKKAQKKDAIAKLSSIEKTAVFVNTLGSPFPSLEKVNELFFWNTTDDELAVRITRAYTASTPGPVIG